MIVLAVVLAAVLLGLVAALAADVGLGAPPRASLERPDLAFRRLARDGRRFLTRRNPRPGSDWPSVLAAAFATGGRVTVRQERIAQADQDLSDLRGHLEAIAHAREWGAAPSEPSADREDETIAARRRMIADGEAVLEARAQAADRFTLVLYGRTKAGKSSLFAALTNTGYDGIGDGGQNYTKELRHWTRAGVELIDSPGINGVGSEVLEADTERAVHSADLLIAQVTDDALDLEDFERLEEAGRHPRPMIVTVNVKKGDLTKLIEQPEKIFRRRKLDPYVKRLRAHLPLGCADAPIVEYHAGAAVAAWIGKWRLREVLWAKSRIAEVIDAVTQSAPSALRYAEEASDLALRDLLVDLVDDEGVAREGILTASKALNSQLDELSGILKEVRLSSSVVARAIDDHFLSAGEAILEALVDPEADFNEAIGDALQLEKLSKLLEDRLGQAADDLSTKYEEFKSDVEMAARLSVGADAFAAIREHVLAQDRARKAHQRSTKVRRFGRIGIRALVTVVSIAQPELIPLAVGVGGVAARLLGDPKPPPPDDPAARQQRVGEILQAAARDAKGEYAAALASQIIEPADLQLVNPLREQRDVLDAIGRSIAEALTDEHRVLERIEGRLHQAQSQEV